jgi:heterotetrameric sarcosine oxidase gamma subunit
MPDLERYSPLPKSAAQFSAGGFQLRELPFVAKLRVQVLRRRGMQTPAASLMHLPDNPNTGLGSDPIALWKAPDDWLVYSPTLTADALNSWVAAVPHNTPLIATDVSSASTVFELSGTNALDILMRDCTLDLEGNAVPPGACAQTQFAQVSVMIHRPTADTWRLFVDRSVAGHVWDWLLDTAERFGPPA